ncbi:type II toxin-antitoxin system RatA family toxin [Halovulum sp. GXIMD14793]
MPTHSETRILPYSPAQMYDLVADIASYPEFLPWCSGARILKRHGGPEGEVVEADLIVSFKVFREKFGSRVTLFPKAQRIEVVYIDGPFKKMDSHWAFAAHEQGCEVTFFVDFEFRSRTLQALIGVVFNQAMQRIVAAFEKRAAALYGAST